MKVERKRRKRRIEGKEKRKKGRTKRNEVEVAEK